MEKFVYEVRLTVQVEAFDASDAFDVVQDSFGVGETGAVYVTDCKYEENRAKRKVV